MSPRTHKASRFIQAPPERIYTALLDPDAVKSWRPPSGMHAEIYDFKPRTGGSFRMAFIYNEAAGSQAKSTPNADIFHGTFVELLPNKAIIELVKFESMDPAYARPMTVTTALEPTNSGTWVTITCENVPTPISEKDHERSIKSTLENLARFTETNLV